MKIFITTKEILVLLLLFSFPALSGDTNMYFSEVIENAPYNECKKAILKGRSLKSPKTPAAAVMNYFFFDDRIYMVMAMGDPAKDESQTGLLCRRSGIIDTTLDLKTYQ